MRRWRDRRMIEAAEGGGGCDGGGSGGYCLEPVRHLVRPSAADAGWTRPRQAALQSAAVKAQWPQVRLHAAGLAEQPFCNLCHVSGIVDESALAGAMAANPPLGTARHRVASCKPTADWHDAALPGWAELRRGISALARSATGAELDGDRQTVEAFNAVVAAEAAPTGRRRGGGGGGNGGSGGASPRPEALADQHGSGGGESVDGDGSQVGGTATSGRRWIRSALRASALARRWVDGNVTVDQWSAAWDTVVRRCSTWASWTRAMVVDEGVQPRVAPDDGTFEWRVEPTDGDALMNAVYYTDASGVDVAHPKLRRLAWAYVAVDADGKVLAAACGETPPWVTSVAMAEAWALTKAAEDAAPSATSCSDCLSVVKLLHGDLA